MQTQRQTDSSPALRLVIACGGTGGHLFPGIAVAQAARARGWETLLLISEKQIDALAVKAHGDLKFEKVPAIGMPKLLSPAMPKFLWRFFRTRRHCARLIREFRADAVLGMGGFTSLPPVMAGRRMGLRTYIHESNAIPGKSNRLTAKYCTAVLLGLEACAKHFPGKTVHVTGTPLRGGMTPADRAEARAFFGLEPDRRTVLVMGGSQGARGVNRAVLEAVEKLKDEADAPQILHITGPTEYESVKAGYEAAPGVKASVAPFCDRMDLAYSAADLAISRSGASSLTELSAFGLPVILVPYPYAAEDHQRRNAEVFTARGAAVVCEEAELSGGRLGDVTRSLLADPAKLESLSRAIREMAPGDAAGRVCDVIAGN